MITRLLALILLLLIAIAPAGAQTGSPGGPPPEQRVIPVAPGGTPVHKQVTVGTSATLIQAANQSRSLITIINHGTTNVFICFTNACTTSNGGLLVGVPGSFIPLSTRTDVWGIAAGTSQVVGVLEENR